MIDPDQSVEDYDPERSSRRRSLVFFISMALIGLTITIGISYHKNISQFFRSEIGTTGQYVYRPKVAVSAAELKKINFEAVHEYLLLDWLLARSKQEDQSEIDDAYREVATTLSPDQNLTSILHEWNELLPKIKNPDSLSRIGYLVWAWNDYLRRNNIGWMLDYSLIPAAEDKIDLFLLGYRIEADFSAKVDNNNINIVYLTRKDLLNIREKFLGITNVAERRARVIRNLCEEFAIRSVWPAIVRSVGKNKSKIQGIENILYEEISKSVSKVQAKNLRESAKKFYALQKQVQKINSRNRCNLDFNLDIDEMDILYGTFDTSLLWAKFYEYESDDCKPIDKREAESLAGKAEWFKMQKMDSVFEILTNHVARGIAVHELRHQGDFQAGYTDGSNCKNCPGHLGDGSKIELSAYIASIAHQETGVINLFQSCEIFHGSRSGSHYEALTYLIPKIVGPSCKTIKSNNFVEKVKKLELQLFGRNSDIELPRTIREKNGLKNR